MTTICVFPWPGHACEICGRVFMAPHSEATLARHAAAPFARGEIDRRSDDAETAIVAHHFDLYESAI